VLVLFCQLVAPANAAVMLWLPEASAAVLNVATPLPFTATPDANVVAPSLNVTVPLGTPPVDVTVAVKVTDCAMPEGFAEELTAVLVTP